MYFVYLLRNDLTGKFYIGITEDYKRRLKEHNTLTRHFTGRIKGKWELIGYKVFDKKQEAWKEELRLKRSKNKKYIDWYFKNKGP